MQLLPQSNFYAQKFYHRLNITQVLIPIANGSEEIEVVTIADILRRAKVNVVVASVEKSVKILASRGTKIIADKLIGDAAEAMYDLIILPVRHKEDCFSNMTSFNCMQSQFQCISRNTLISNCYLGQKISIVVLSQGEMFVHCLYDTSK